MISNTIIILLIRTAPLLPFLVCSQRAKLETPSEIKKKKNPPTVDINHYVYTHHFTKLSLDESARNDKDCKSFSNY